MSVNMILSLLQREAYTHQSVVSQVTVDDNKTSNPKASNKMFLYRSFYSKKYVLYESEKFDLPTNKNIGRRKKEFLLILKTNFKVSKRNGYSNILTFVRIFH